jgi:hypothetical protein
MKYFKLANYQFFQTALPTLFLHPSPGFKKISGNDAKTQRFPQKKLLRRRGVARKSNWVV